jgi:hypothetical protein
MPFFLGQQINRSLQVAEAESNDDRTTAIAA